MRNALLAVGALCLPFLALAQEGPPAEPLSHRATLRVAGKSTPLTISSGISGPLFELAPIVERLGGQLMVGPLGESHRLLIADTEALFGPGAGVMTIGREIFPLSQKPVAAASGLRVPLDLLRKSYGDLVGLEFLWHADEQVLEVARRRAREIGVDLQVVHIQGISTVVLQFDETPSYSVKNRGRIVDIEVPVDRIRLQRRPSPTRGALVESIEAGEHRLRLQLAPDASAAEPYVLSSSPGHAAGRGLRLVFDISRSGSLFGEEEMILPPGGRHTAAPGLQTVVLDPGHGGSEQGAIGPSGTEEKTLTLILAKALKRELEERLPVRVLLTRSEDADLPLDTRTALANQNQADLFVSLHLNASPDPSARGAETYFLSLEASDERAQQVAEAENRGEMPDSDAGEDGLQLLLWDLAQSHHLAASQRLASLIQGELNEALDLPNRGVRQAPFAVLMGATMPAVLVELGFISNFDEEARLLDPAYRAQLVDAIVRAVLRFDALSRAEERHASAERE